MQYTREVHVHPETFPETMAEDVRRGLTHTPKFLPPKYFYDPRGSALFEQITELPEYYLTRTEHELLRRVAPGLIRHLRPREIVELGSGASAKVRHLLDALDGAPVRYLPVDVDEQMVARAAGELIRGYPLLRIHGIIGDFERHLPRLPAPAGRRLVAFLGSTLGNLDPPARHAFLREVRRLLLPGDQFLLGIDLVKDPAALEAAYDDAQGVTAEFNRNILHVINRTLQANFRVEAFEHRARYNRPAARIEMHLHPRSPQTVRLAALDLTVTITPEEGIWTESSYKFTRESCVSMLRAAGMRMDDWLTDLGRQFALTLASPVGMPESGREAPAEREGLTPVPAW